jgi:hypothetical protein
MFGVLHRVKGRVDIDQQAADLGQVLLGVLLAVGLTSRFVR